MDIRAYLDRIGFSGTPKVDVECLKTLQKLHQFHIPFENLDIYVGRQIVLKPAQFAHKIIHEKRGGFCYELNGLFCQLLREIGFDVQMISARVKTEEGIYSLPFSHLSLIVHLEDKWLVDVGFGGFSLEPLKLEVGLDQQQFDGVYRIEQAEADRFFLWKKPHGEEFQDKYTFTLAPRNLQDFKDMCHYQQTHPDSFFLKQRLCTQANPNGRVTLTDTKLIITTATDKVVTEVSSLSQFNQLLLQKFGIKYDRIPLSYPKTPN